MTADKNQREGAPVDSITLDRSEMVYAICCAQMLTALLLIFMWSMVELMTVVGSGCDCRCVQAGPSAMGEG